MDEIHSIDDDHRLCQILRQYKKTYWTDKNLSKILYEDDVRMLYLKLRKINHKVKLLVTKTVCVPQKTVA